MPSRKFRAEVEKRGPPTDFHPDLAKRWSGFLKKRSGGLFARQAAPTCVPANATALDMSYLLYSGGYGYKMQLCPNTNYNINDTVYFYNQNQEISTLGYPTGNSRATLTVVGAQQSVAIYMIWIGGTIRNIQINGNRPALGWLGVSRRFGSVFALIRVIGRICAHRDGRSLPRLVRAELQLVRTPRLERVRNSLLVRYADLEQTAHRRGLMQRRNVPVQRLQGHQQPDRSRGHGAKHQLAVQARFERLGPAAPRRVERSGTMVSAFVTLETRLTLSLRADGISLACSNSIVSGNTIVDATDGMIVIFEAPGSQITDNVYVKASDQQIVR
jgi:hypothetical protein